MEEKPVSKRVIKKIKKEAKMTPAGERTDPYRKFNFVVELDGIAATGFISVEGIETLTDVIHYREGNEAAVQRKLPGLHKFTNITLKRGVTSNRELWEWRKTVLDGRTERKNGSIVVLDESRQQVMRVNFQDAWPCRWKVGALESMESDVLIEELELVVERLDLD